MNEALILIDIQNDYFEGGKNPLTNPLKALACTKIVLDKFRNDNKLIIHVQHINEKEGATFFLPNTFGAEIHKDLTPLENEITIIKHFPNSFFKTDLLSILEKNQVKNITVCGMMSHMCIDTTVRSAKDFELNVTLIANACATKDLTFNGKTVSAENVQTAYFAGLNGMFANVLVEY